jgi:hypothetical protein
MNRLKPIVVTCSNTLRSSIYYIVKNTTLLPVTYHVKAPDYRGQNKTFDTFTCEPLSTYVSKEFYPPVTVSHATDEDIKKAKTT